MKMFHRCVSESVSDYQESVSECVSESKEGFRYVSESDTPILIIERSGGGGGEDRHTMLNHLQMGITA